MVTFLQDVFSFHFPQMYFYKEPEISQWSKTSHCFSLFCEIKFPTRQFNNFSDVLPLVEWDFHLKSVKAYIAPLSCPSILTIWLWGLWHSPRIMCLYFVSFHSPAAASSMLHLQACDFHACVHLFDIYCSSPSPSIRTIHSKEDIYLSIVIFQAGITSQNIPIRCERWYLPNSVDSF